MDNKKEKTANIDSEITAKATGAQNVTTPTLYAHGLEYAENIKKKEEAVSKKQ